MEAMVVMIIMVDTVQDSTTMEMGLDGAVTLGQTGAGRWGAVAQEEPSEEELHTKEKTSFHHPSSSAAKWLNQEHQIIESEE